MGNDSPESSGLSGLSSSIGPSAIPPFRPPHAPGPLAVPDHVLLRLIGRGSYGNVWLARNATGSLRAVKVVYRSAFDHDRPYEREFEGIRQFEPVSHARESQVDIFHVGINKEGGFFYYIMELADDANGRPLAMLSGPAGEEYLPHTLRADLRARGALPLNECLEIGLALTRALGHLHGHGLVHRDVKPSNVIFVNGTPKLADIGLVTSLEATLSYVGTEGYIPPEGPGTPQGDLYSLGKLLYEISTGRDRLDFPELPDAWRNHPDRERLLEFNEILVKACDGDRDQRYQTAAAMHADLLRLQRGKSIRWRQRRDQAGILARRAAPVFLLAALGFMAFSLIWSARRMTPATSDKAAVFVLPFRSTATNQVPDDLCSRVTDAFIDALASIEGVRRSPRKSGWRHQDEDELRRSLAKTNSMRHVLTGRLATQNGDLTLALALYSRRGGQPIWTGTFTGKSNEMVALERQALDELTGRLRLRIRATESERIGSLLTNNLQALQLMRRAWSRYDRVAGAQAGYTEVQELAQEALNLDQLYLDAAFYDAYMFRILAQGLRRPMEIWPRLRDSMSAILSQDDTHAMALDASAAWPFIVHRDWEAVDAIMDRLFAALPAGPQPFNRSFYRAFWFRIHGWLEEARIEQELADSPEPTAADLRSYMASSLWVERRYAEGAQVARRTLELYRDHVEGYSMLAHCLVADGQYDEGLAAIEKGWQTKKQEMTALKGWTYARQGQFNKARDVLRELLQMGHADDTYLQPYFVARVYAAFAEKEMSLGWLEQAEEDRCIALDWLEKAEGDCSEYLLLPDLGGLRTDLAWDNLREEPRFKKLLKKVGLDVWPRPKRRR